MRSLFASDRAEAARNMCCMFMTPEMSKLSGWLKADAPKNILLMSVTLDVSQLDMSALNCFKSWNSPFMLVTAETPQLEMGPYVAVAEAASALYSRAAVFRASKSVKALGEHVPHVTGHSEVNQP